ncbi:MAG: L,D-transpeptidase family protein [Hyphomicrobium sp.]
MAAIEGDVTGYPSISFVRTLLASAIVAFAATVAGSASAQDFSWIQAGPTGNGPGTNTYDREFIREWEANPPKGFATLSKANIEPTKAAIKRYTDVVAAGGWAPVPEMQMQAGHLDPAVRLLRLRLAASGDFKDDDTTSTNFDLDLEKAVKRFQASNGLTPTGIVDKRTIAALNVPAAARLKQLKTNLGRLADLAASTGKKYVVVNIPSAHIEAVENGQIVARYAGVVGKIDRQTPLLRSSITDLNFNPMWRMPPTVESEDLIPRGRDMQKKGQNVLHKFHIDAYSGSGKKVDPDSIDWTKVRPGTYTYSQQPGKDNPLGFLKINFDSAHSVYMHDTPSETIFGRNFRSASSGCIRVHNIEHLANWLLADQPGWNKDRVAKMKETGERLDVRLKKPVQLHFVYVTAWATEDGIVQFRRDLYQRDGVGAVAAAY